MLQFVFGYPEQSSRTTRLSHGREDLVCVIDGRAAVVEEAEGSPLVNILRAEIVVLLDTDEFVSSLQSSGAIGMRDD